MSPLTLILLLIPPYLALACAIGSWIHRRGRENKPILPRFRPKPVQVQTNGDEDESYPATKKGFRL